MNIPNKSSILQGIVGISLISLGIAVCISANLGIDPLTGLVLALSDYLNLTLGAMNLLFNFVLLIIIAIIAKHLIGIGTWISMIAVGYLIDIFLAILPIEWIQQSTIWLHLVVFFIGMWVIAFGIAFFSYSNLGMAPYDTMPFALEYVTSYSNVVYRTLQDIITAVLAWIIGGPVFIGTFILAFCLGPFIAISRKAVRRVLKIHT